MPGICTLLGEIDIASAPGFSASILDSIDGSDEVIVHVDCAGVTFMDSAGFHVLVDATTYAARRGQTLVVRNARGSCATVIRICDRDQLLHLDG